ncbi:hypothetical protein UFOVP398_38 [uncultured Caudovirales phage]|uniref:Uncharacterized protein n=1 Tax=uncultured Caudovirales phage TaxID=2100421 RepID=A0A6J5M9P4_9CAUD|nr:hypothetical protein UFOVP398_38 [uncultured Caudovirales phage]
MNLSELSYPDQVAAILTATRKAIYSAMGRLHSGTSGRPKNPDRCPCGAMTKARAIKRRHVCTASASEVAAPPNNNT